MSPVNVSTIDQLRIGLASAKDIHSWTSGEVKKPETVNYRTNKPEKDGLFCEKIFGPQKAWECACGKYKRVHVKGLVCERCGVEVTSDKVRRERMGHIQLQAPVVHIWYLRGTRSWLTYLLMGLDPKEELKAKQLEKVVYYSARLVTFVDVARRAEDLKTLAEALEDETKDILAGRERTLERYQREFEARLEYLKNDNSRDAELRTAQKEFDERCLEARDGAQLAIDMANQAFDTFRTLHSRQIIEDELLYREMLMRYEEYFEGGMGADAILQLIDRMDLDAEEAQMVEMLDGKSGVKISAQRHAKLLKRLAVVQAFNRRDDNGRRMNDPSAMILQVLPVIPPDLRPMVQLDGGRQATSDLNDLYRHVINRNNRLKKLLESDSPAIIVNNERRMLQEAVDALIDNGRHGRAASGPSGRPAKSLTDVLKGKQGRFRQNLLGKRVDYSARSVIVVGPRLKLHQCGLPKIMALELFKPFVMRALMADGTAQNIRSAKRMVEQRHVAVWEKLEYVTREHPVLLNRAPTLHRLGVQAFEPVLVDGKAIQVHPLVCKAFNADFDGDTMAVHVPLSAEAQAEARILMLSVNNIFTPATGRAITEPSQDMVLGIYYLTRDAKIKVERPPVYRQIHEIEAALERNIITLHTEIELRTSTDASESSLAARLASGDFAAEGARRSIRTTPGRVIFNEALPSGYRFINQLVGKNSLPIGVIVEEIANGYTRKQVANALDAIKDLGFRYASQSGLTIGFDDIVTSPRKAEILDSYEKDAEKVEQNFNKGVIIDEERRQLQIDIWTRANRELSDVCYGALDAQVDNPIRMMVDSGARGNRQQILQITAMKGLVVNSRGEIEHRPAKSSFREGLTSWEYFVSLHGTRKGLADTALRTADSGYLTRRLVDVAQELIIKEMNCGTSRSLLIENVAPDTAAVRSHLETKLWGRMLAQDLETSDGVLPAGTILAIADVERLRDDAKVGSIRVRTTLVCEAAEGICASCYGLSLATHELVELGEAVGVVAAQSIGEPGTQLTMRTFHSGGVGGRDITHGLPRVVELFEARSPKGAATMAEHSGVVRIERSDAPGVNAAAKVLVIANNGDIQEALIPPRDLIVAEGAEVEAGQPLNRGPLDPKMIMELRGTRDAQRYLVEEVQGVYRDQGVSIHDKHIELVVRQMTRRIQVVNKGDSDFLPGALIDAKNFDDSNKGLESSGKALADGRARMMGITKTSLSTDSWLAAASFQETTRVLTEAAISGKRDDLIGLKENIIIGKLIPAGLGQPHFAARQIKLEMPNAELLPEWATWRDDDSDLADILGEIGDHNSDTLDDDLRDFLSIGEGNYTALDDLLGGPDEPASGE